MHRFTTAEESWEWTADLNATNLHVARPKDDALGEIKATTCDA